MSEVPLYLIPKIPELKPEFVPSVEAIRENSCSLFVAYRLYIVYRQVF